MGDRVMVQNGIRCSVLTTACHFSGTRLRTHLRCLLFYLFLALWLLAVLILLLSLLLLDTHPAWDNPHVTPQPVGTTHNLLHQLHTAPHDPGSRQWTLNAGDIEAIAGFLLMRKGWEGSVKCSLNTPHLICQLSLKLPRGLPGFMNVSVTLEETGQQLNVAQLHIGHLDLPVSLATSLLEQLKWSRYISLRERLVRAIQIQNDELRVVLNWDDELFDKAENWIQDLVSKERYMIYREHLQKTLTQSPHKRFVRLATLMQTLFKLASDRSGQDNLPATENAAVIMVLNAYVNGGTPTNWLTANSAGKDMPRLQVLLKGRIDTARHFLASAALTLSGTGEFTDLIGLAKELNDTHGGSGFSFIDLAADRSGITFAQIATASDSSARATQMLLSHSTDEARFMTDISDLPENLDASNFRDQFKSVDSPEFTAVENLIETRLAALPINHHAAQALQEPEPETARKQPIATHP